MGFYRGEGKKKWDFHFYALWMVDLKSGRVEIPILCNKKKKKCKRNQFENESQRTHTSYYSKLIASYFEIKLPSNIQ